MSVVAGGGAGADEAGADDGGGAGVVVVPAGEVRTEAAAEETELAGTIERSLLCVAQYWRYCPRLGISGVTLLGKSCFLSPMQLLQDPKRRENEPPEGHSALKFLPVA